MSFIKFNIATELSKLRRGKRTKVGRETILRVAESHFRTLKRQGK